MSFGQAWGPIKGAQGPIAVSRLRCRPTAAIHEKRESASFVKGGESTPGRRSPCLSVSVIVLSVPVASHSTSSADEELEQARTSDFATLRGRIHSIDAIRGFCLLNIFINHLSAGVLNRASPSNLGLSDSADLFVLLAGVSAYLASGNRRFRECTVHLWERAASLYLQNIVLITVSLATLLLLSLAAGADALLDGGLVGSLAAMDTATAVWHLISFQQSVGYSMVLRLYVALMLLAPVLIWLARRQWWLPLPIVTLIWAIAAHLDLVARDSLTGAPLTLTILPWTLIFGIGLALGAALKQGVRLSRSPLLLAGALVVVGGYFAFLIVAQAWPEGQTWLLARNDEFWLGGSKTYQSPLRVLHTLSLVYIFMRGAQAPVLRLIHNVGPDNLFVRLGRRSAPVFLAGALVAVPANELVNLANQAWGAHSAPAVLTELILVVSGIALMIFVANRTGLRIGPSLAGPRRVQPSSQT